MGENEKKNSNVGYAMCDEPWFEKKKKPANTTKTNEV